MRAVGWILPTLVLASSTTATALIMSGDHKATITGLYRHAVKGLSADSLDRVHIANAYDPFPDDRRFALLYDKKVEKWREQEESPEWLHKGNFLCAFTNPKLMAQYEASYQIIESTPSSSSSSSSSGPENTYGVPCDTISTARQEETRRLLKLRDRTSQDIVFGPEDLATESGRSSLSDFFSRQSGLPVTCVTADNRQQQQKHQFGNTSSGWKQRRDTRTVHLVNANTVRNVAEVCQVSINPTRFRPNIVVEGWEPWAEFDWIGKQLEVKTSKGTTKLSILSKTVRCEGVSVDPLDPETVLDIPKLLSKHFPHHGPYLGVYAVIEDPGVISIGDEVSLLDL